VTGLEPRSPLWEADVLPLNTTPAWSGDRYSGRERFDLPDHSPARTECAVTGTSDDEAPVRFQPY